MDEYSALVAQLLCMPKMGTKVDLKIIRALDRALGSPSSAFASVHIGGTNGKGSCATMMAAALSATGKRVGLFTSPHIATFRERIQIDAQLISEKEVADLLPQVFAAAKKLGIRPSFFEIVTALAFVYFMASAVDIAVIEVGLGGQLDATNIVKPLISIITSIGLDHTHLLGNTLEAIAQEKGGIIKSKTPVVLGPSARYSVLRDRCKAQQCPLFEVKGPFAHYELENRAIAKAALNVLKVDKQAIEMGFNITPPCRFEVIEKKIPVVLDVAHNVSGLEALFFRLEKKFPNKEFRALAAFSVDKSHASLLHFLKKKTNMLYLTQGAHPRVEPLENLPLSHLDYCNPNIEDSFNRAYCEAQKNNEVLVVCGTFYIMAKIRALLGIREPLDTESLSDTAPLQKK